jgi:hypothetical protein
MTILEDILAGVLRDLGPDASDEDLKTKVLETLEALPPEEKREALEEMVQLASTRQLSRLEEVEGAERGGQESPGQSD